MTAAASRKKKIKGRASLHSAKSRKAETPSPQPQPENFGYQIVLTRATKGAGYRIVSGCRDFTPTQALKHWTDRPKELNAICGDPNCTSCRVVNDRARKMVALLPKLKARARRYGWL